MGKKKNQDQTSNSSNEEISPEFPQKTQNYPLTYRWTEEENSLYLGALKQMKGELEGEIAIRRTKKVFKRMSELFSNGRTAKQVQDHHKKYKDRYKTVEGIIQYLQGKLYGRQREMLDQNKEKQEEQEKFQNWEHNWWKSFIDSQ